MVERGTLRQRREPAVKGAIQARSTLTTEATGGLTNPQECWTGRSSLYEETLADPQ
jgi:hypothetical protein